MNPLRNRKSDDDHHLPPEAYEYEDDVTPEAVKELQEKADKVLGDGEWTAVDGSVLAKSTPVG